MSLSLPSESVDFWINKKDYKFALDVLYVSNLNENEFLKIDPNIFDGILGDNSFRQMIAVPNEELNQQPWITLVFDEAFKLHTNYKARTMMGRYVRFIFAYGPKEHASYAADYIDLAANLLRLKFGISAAAEKADSVTHNLIEKNFSRTSNSFLLPSSYELGFENSNNFYNNYKLSELLNSNLKLKYDVSIFFSQAFEIHDFNHRFLFLWMALEAQLGQGKEREAFCLNELKSEKISKGMSAIHKIRSNYAHNLAKNDKNEIIKATQKLLEFLRLSAIQDVKIRDDLVKFIEKSL